MSRGPTRNRRSMARARLEADAAATGQPLPPLPGTPAKKPRHVEDDEQEALFTWAELAKARWPDLALLYAIPNGGKRATFEAARLRKQGVKAGVLDLDLPIASYIAGPVEPHYGDDGSVKMARPVRYIGLRIELKRPIVKGEDKPVVSAAQAWWASNLQRVGHCVCVCYGWAQAKEAIEAYLHGRPVPHQWSPK